MMINGMHHVAITTTDLEGLAAFYQEHFGAEILRRIEWQAGNESFDTLLGLENSAGRIVMLGFGAMRLELTEFIAPREEPQSGLHPVFRPGFSHIAFQVDDCRAEYDGLVEAGMQFNAPPVTMPSGGVFAYGRDPDGNIIEILQLPPAS